MRKNQKKKKALCIIGARQIGKTTIIREFAKEQYEHFVEINFILDKGAEKIFEGKLDANTIIENLTAFKMNEYVYVSEWKSDRTIGDLSEGFIS